MKNIIIRLLVDILLRLCDAWSLSGSEVRDIMVEYPEEYANKCLGEASFYWINESGKTNRGFRKAMRKIDEEKS